MEHADGGVGDYQRRPRRNTRKIRNSSSVNAAATRTHVSLRLLRPKSMARLYRFERFEHRGWLMGRIHRFLLGVIVLLAAFPGIVDLAAQTERFLGIWELNLPKSSITRGAPPLSEMIVNVAEPGGFKSMLSVVTARGTSVEIHHYNFDGAFHQTEGSDPRELSFRRVNQNTIEQDTRRDGQVTVKRKIELSADGKTMTLVASGTSGGGQKYENDTRVYDRR